MGKARRHYRHYFQTNLFLPIFGLSTLYLQLLYLTQPAGLATLNRSTGSMSVYGHAAGNALEGGFSSQK